MHPGNLRRSGYDPSVDRVHHLGLLIGQGVSACAIHDTRTGEPQFISWAPDVPALLIAALPRHPRSVSFVLLPEWSTLVPDGALGTDLGKQHLALVHGRMPSGAVHDEPVRTLGATCLYINDGTQEQFVVDRFPNARSLPLQAILVRSAQARSTVEPVLLLHRGMERTDVCIAQGQRVLLSTSYPVRTAEDLLYFCLLAAERCGLAPDKVALRYGGTHLEPVERNILQRYFTRAASATPALWPGISDEIATSIDQWSVAVDQFACVS